MTVASGGSRWRPLLVLVILVLIAISTTQQAASWFSTEGLGIFGTIWNPAANKFGALPFLYGTAGSSRSISTAAAARPSTGAVTRMGSTPMEPSTPTVTGAW